MLIQPLYGLIAGATVSFSVGHKILKIERDGKVKFINPFNLKVAGSPKNAHFRKLLSIADDSKEGYMLARIDIQEEDEISVGIRQILERGLPCTIDMEKFPSHQWGIEGIEDLDFEANMFLVLSTHHGTLSVLSVIGLSPPAMVHRDENIVAVMDILGFSEINRHLSLDTIEEKFTEVLGSILMGWQMRSSGCVIFDDDGSAKAPPEELLPIGHRIISDTILLYLRNKKMDPLRIMCESVATLLDQNLVMEKWLLRGAIDIGSFRAIPDQNLFLGEAVANAHQLETSQEWGGCVVSERICDRFPEEVGALIKEGLLVRFDVPFKSLSGIKRRNSVAINWSYLETGMKGGRRDVLSSLFQKAPPKIKHKVEFTISFLEEMERLGLASMMNKPIKAINIPSEWRNSIKCIKTDP